MNKYAMSAFRKLWKTIRGKEYDWPYDNVEMKDDLNELLSCADVRIRRLTAELKGFKEAKTS